MENPVLVVVGTRPDAIKLIPVYKALKNLGVDVRLCATFQHDHLLRQVFDTFNITPDVCLGVMQKGQDLFYLTTTLLEKLKVVYLDIKPSYVIVQGDTTTSLCAALAAFYLNIKIAHVEAGLRTGDLRAPFPEEANRKIIGTLANYHFPPTTMSRLALLQENIPAESIHCVGNTGIDALYWIEQQLETGAISPSQSLQQLVAQFRQNNQKIVLLTAHRRESFGTTLTAIFNGIATFLQEHHDVVIVYPTHPNPQVLQALDASGIRNLPNSVILEPVAYHDLVFLLRACDWVMTDSGGIQEEAASLGRQSLVLRTVTERNEGVLLGVAKLAGTDAPTIQKNMLELYASENPHIPRSTIYGDGTASVKIASLIAENFVYLQRPDELLKNA